MEWSGRGVPLRWGEGSRERLGQQEEEEGGRWCSDGLKAEGAEKEIAVL